MFNKISSPKKSVFVAEQIIKNIENDTFRIGELLPPEQVIADEIGVSRASVREAMAALELVGIIERRAGHGTVVISKLPVSQSQAIRILQENAGSVEAVEARSVIEPGIAMLASERMNDSDYAILESFVNKMKAASEENDLDSFIEADFDFHNYLAKCSKNPVLETTMDQYLMLMRHQLWKFIKAKCFSDKSETTETHIKILKAIRSKDAALITAAVKDHFEEIFKNLSWEAKGS